MKRILLLFSIILFIGLKVQSQTYFPGPGIPPSSTSFSPTFRTLAHVTDSLQNFYWSNGTKWYQVYSAAQINSILAGHPIAWSLITGKPTTLSGYGITDAYPLTGNPSGFLTAITGAQVTTALGFTPYNSTNPSNYIALTALSGAAPITYNSSTGAIGITQATTTTNGYLSSIDWNNFAGKQSSLHIINVKDYGATGNGTTDDSAAIQNAANAVPSTGGVLYFPPGNYLISSAINIPNQTRVIGSGGQFGIAPATFPTITNKAITTITSNSLTANGLVFNTDASSIEHISIVNSNTTTTLPTAGAGILLNSGMGFRLQDVDISYFYNNMTVVNGFEWHIDGMHNWSPVNYGLYVQDVAVPDGGDQSITSSWFDSQSLTATELRYESGGGLKLNNVKFNRISSSYGIAVDINIKGSTVLFQMSNCSIENYANYGVRITAATGKTYGIIHLTGNEISGPAGYPVYIDPSIGGGSINDITVEGNFLNTNVAANAALTIRNCTVVKVGTNNYGASAIKYDFTGSYSPDGTTRITHDRNVGKQTLSISAGASTWDYNKGTFAGITLNQNTTITPTNTVSGDMAYLIVQQDATGGRTLSIPGIVWMGNNVINPAPNSFSYVLLNENAGHVVSDYLQEAKVYGSPNGFTGYTVSTLPTGISGMTTYVSDATSNTGTLTGGGSLIAPVFYNGTAWKTVNDNTGFAPLASPGFTGVPTAPTPATADNSTAIATTAYVQANFAATTTYFTPGMFIGAGSSASPYNWGTATIPNSALVNSTISGIALGGNLASLTQGAGIAAFSYNGSGAATVAVDYTQTPTWTGSPTFQNNAITTTATPWVILNNGTVATSGTSQLLSPAASFRAHHWTGTADAYTDVMFYNEADSFGTYLTAAYSSNGGAPSKIFQLSQYGDLNAFGTASSGSIQMSKTSMATTSSDGLILTSAASAATSGVPVRYSPDEKFTSMVWNLSGTPASNQLDFKVENRPISSSAPTGNLVWSSRLSTSGSGAYNDLLSLSSTGNILLGAATSTATTTPLIASLGGTYGTNSVGNPGNIKLKIFDSGSAWFGIGASAGLMEFQVPASAGMSFFTNGSTTPSLNLDASGNSTFNGTVSLKHIIGNSSAPTIAAGTGAGTSPTVSISGTDASGTISVTTGSSPAATATLITVTFNTAYGSAPRVMITPGNGTAAITAQGTAYVLCPAVGQSGGPTTTAFTLQTNAALTAASTYIWNYQVLQ